MADKASGLPIFSLYGEERRPTSEMFDLLDYEMPSLHPSRIGHFNRVGGYRALLPHLS